MRYPGTRCIGRRSGDGFLAGDFIDTVHAQAQAVWDVRRLMHWLHSQGAPAVGTYGLTFETEADECPGQARIDATVDGESLQSLVIDVTCTAETAGAGPERGCSNCAAGASPLLWLFVAFLLAKLRRRRSA